MTARGAFDCIKFESAAKCMRRKGVPENIVSWYVNLLKGRQVHAEIQGQRTHIRPHRGSPQGGVLSPLVWNHIMDSLLSTFKKDSVRVIGYADDILLYIIGKSVDSMTEVIQPALDRVLVWGTENGLSFNPTKTSMVLFTRSRKPIKPKLSMGGEHLRLQNSFKYLGVEIHRSLCWTKHVQERVNKCKYLLNKCRNLISRTWGLKPQKIEWIHKAMVRPKLAYGAVVWAHKLTKGMENKLNKVQRLAMLPITQPLRSTPTSGLEALLGWIPLCAYVQEAGMNTYIRNKNTVIPGWDGIGRQNVTTGHLGAWRKRERSIPKLACPRDNRVSEYIWLQEWPDTEKFEHPLALYTDASKSGDNVGYSWIASIGDFIIDWDTLCAKDISVHKAEMLAIKEALSWTKEHAERTRDTVIYSDSNSVVQALNGSLAKDTLTRDTRMLMRDISGITSVTIQWIKGHSGITGNELVDMMAKHGAKAAQQMADTKPHMYLSIKEVKRLIHEHFIEEWQRRWDALNGCRISKLFYPLVRESRKVVLLKVRELQKLAQCVTGHGLF